MNESEFAGLVELHRQEQLMSVPPGDLLARARRTRTIRRRRAAAIPAGVLVAAALVAGAAHSVGQLTQPGDRGISLVPRPPAASLVSTPTSRLVGLNGWVVRIPASWGTDRIGCDRAGQIRPSVLFDHHGPPLRPTRACPWPRETAPFLRIGDERFAGVPWHTISGVMVVQRRVALCRACATLRVPTAGVSFEIHATNLHGLRRIEQSLHPIASHQVTVPIWTTSPTGRQALDQMTTIATGQGLRPHVFEIPSRRPPGTFLRSDPPLGTPVDLGHAIALYFSAGDLARFATAPSLGRHGWRIFPVATYQPSYGRAEAIQAAGITRRDDPRPRAFLRTLTITHEGPRHVVVRRRLAWLVVSRPSGPRGPVSITAVDAFTDRVIESQSGFHGRRG